MKKIIAIIGIVVLIFAAFYFLEIDLSGIFSQTPSDYDNVSKTVKEEYGDVTIGEITHEDDCRICDADGCVYTGEPCWKVEITTEEGEKSEVVVDDSNPSEPSGPSGGGAPSEEDTGEVCYYVKTEQGNHVLFTYYNIGCNNPLPVCDEGLFCRECQNPNECIRKSFHDFEFTEDDFFEYQIVGVPNFHAAFIELNTECIIDNSTQLLYSNSTSIQECESIILNMTLCDTGVCKSIIGEVFEDNQD